MSAKQQPIALEWKTVNRKSVREETPVIDVHGYAASVVTEQADGETFAVVNVWHHGNPQGYNSREVMRERFFALQGEDSAGLMARCKQIAALVIESDVKLRAKIARLK